MLKYSPVVRYGIPKFKSAKKRDSWWKKQRDRCLEGYKPPHGVWIPGNYYYYLNFTKIERLNEKTGRKDLQYPWYRDLDHEFFDKFNKAKEEGKGIIVLKSRDKGFSYNSAGILLHEYTFYPRNTVGIGCPDDEKLNEFKNHLVNLRDGMPEEFQHGFLRHNEDEWQSGREVKIDGEWKKVGYKSRIQFRIMDTPDKFRSGRQSVVVYDEFGEFKYPYKSYEFLKANLREGAVQFGVPILGGTSNIMSRDNTAFIEMFNEAEQRNLIPHFIPASKGYYGFFDEKTGKSKIKEAEREIKKERAKLKKLKDKTAYYSHCQEYPLRPQDVFMVGSGGGFDLDKIDEQRELILNNPKVKNYITRGDLKWKNKKKWEVDFIPNPDGKIQILKHPLDEYHNAEVGGVDPYHKDEAPSSDSKGSCFIHRRFINVNIPSELPVAQYTDRPEFKEEFYDNCMKLAAYYNCKLLVEDNDDRFFEYFVRAGAQRFLKERPQVFDTIHTTATNKFGIPMKNTQKTKLFELVDEYIKRYYTDIYFLDLLNEMVDFGVKNTDRCDAFGIALIHAEDEKDISVKKKNAKEKSKNLKMPTFKRASDGRVVLDNKKKKKKLNKF